MRPLRIVSILVGIQIALIATSFAFLAYSESQSALMGNLINTAGKNRLLANNVQLELNRALSNTHDLHPLVSTALVEMEDNIKILKTGGFIDEVEIPPLPPEFSLEQDRLHDTFLSYKLMVIGLLDSKPVLNFEIVERATITNKVLISMSDSIAKDLGRHSESVTLQHVHFQILLGLINVAILIIMVLFIWRILKRHTERVVRDEKFETIGKFASMMAHDIRNPLGALRNSVEIMQRSNLPTSLDAEVLRVNRSIWRISHQIEGVLNYARAVPITVSPKSVAVILHKSVGMLSIPDNVTLTLPDANDSSSGSADSGAATTAVYDNDAVVDCDSEKLEFVFVNLLLNAIQAIGDDLGYVMVRIKNGGSVYDNGNKHNDGVSYEDRDGVVDNGVDYVMIEFENSGLIPAEDLPHVFEPLFTTKMQGTGLGLTSCMNVVDLHNGKMTAVNTDRSVIFTVYLPKTHVASDGRGYANGANGGT